MKSLRFPGLIMLLLMAVISVFSQKPVTKNFEPHSGQDGKDVVWVPTPQELVDKMLDMAKVTAKDYVMDLGSGDGRLVITAAKRGAKATGVEYNPEMVELSKQNAAKAGVEDKANFLNADLFETDISKATVITLFLLTDLNVRLRPKLLELKPGTRIVSNTFTMQEWEPDETATIDDCYSWCTAYLWIIPAKVEGTWKIQQAQEEIRLKQQFQKVSGTYKNGKSSEEITAGKLFGTEITFSANGSKYSGTVNGKTITGTVTNGSGKKAFTAVKSN